MSDYQVEIIVRNGKIKKLMEHHNYKTVSHLAIAAGTQPSVLGLIINLQVSPLKKNGDWRKPVMDLASVFGVEPEDMFTVKQLSSLMESNRASTYLAEAELVVGIESARRMAIPPDVAFEDKELRGLLTAAMEDLTHREKHVIKLRYGLDGNDSHTLRDTGYLLGVSPERIRQIEAKAMRRLRHPSRKKRILEKLEIRGKL